MTVQGDEDHRASVLESRWPFFMPGLENSCRARRHHTIGVQDTGGYPVAIQELVRCKMTASLGHKQPNLAAIIRDCWTVVRAQGANFTGTRKARFCWAR